MSGLFSNLVARTLRLGPSLSPNLRPAFDSWAGPVQPDPAAVEESGPALELPLTTLPVIRTAEEAPSRRSPDPPALGADAPKTRRRDRNGAVTPAPSPLARRDDRPSAKITAADEAGPSASNTVASLGPPDEAPGISSIPPIGRPPGKLIVKTHRLEPVQSPVPQRAGSAARGDRRPAEPSIRRSKISSEQQPQPPSLPGPRRSAAPAAGQLALPTVPVPAEQPAPAPAPDVHITIGCVEVRAAQDPLKPAPRAPVSTDRPRPISLSDYLAQRAAR